MKDMITSPNPTPILTHPESPQSEGLKGVLPARLLLMRPHSRSNPLGHTSQSLGSQLGDAAQHGHEVGCDLGAMFGPCQTGCALLPSSTSAPNRPTGTAFASKPKVRFWGLLPLHCCLFCRRSGCSPVYRGFDPKTSGQTRPAHPPTRLRNPPAWCLKKSAVSVVAWKACSTVFKCLGSEKTSPGSRGFFT